VSWKVYQNELSVGVGFEPEEDAWLANFGDNPLEFFTQFQVRFAESRRRFVDRCVQDLPAEIGGLLAKFAAAPATSTAEAAKLAEQIAQKSALLQQAEQERTKWTQERFDGLAERDKNLHRKAFSTNSADAEFHTLTEITYQDDSERRRVRVPKG